jgi:hypothetical protein
MPQHLREFDESSANEDIADVDVSEITSWIDSSELHPVAIEYGLLNMLDRPSDAQNDRIQEILDEAVDDSVLSFWVHEVNHILGHLQGRLDDEHRRDYERKKMDLNIDALQFKGLIKRSDLGEIYRFTKSYLEKKVGNANGNSTTCHII